ncbi:DUF6039 family protein [Streptomyces sp. NPDC057148]|uniref:DUF6039 family protein n=1 Tax=unclassified Streptomyces TaxID=2593676 RepID=UPI0036383D2E
MPTQSGDPVVPTAQQQASVPLDRLMHSGNSGLIVHRSGQLLYDFAAEGRNFSVDLLSYLNDSQAGVISTYLYEEVFGVQDRLHWFINMKSPHNYQRLLEMVDHDAEFQDISLSDRLPEKGHGNWERMFAPGSLQERIICPQHGMSHPPEGEVDPAELFVEPARYQTSQPPKEQLNSATAGAVVMRTADVHYDLRKEARAFAFDWQEYLNRALSGHVTSFLYEETFGKQDRIHWLIHLRTLDDYGRVVELGRRDAGYQDLFARQRVPDHKGGGAWGGLFVPGSIHDTVLVPYLHHSR